MGARLRLWSDQPSTVVGVIGDLMDLPWSDALPGGVYVYQGEELGLPEVEEEIPNHLRQDPFYRRSGYTDPGRDGCRVPIPWAGDAPPFGFSPADAAADPWLPQPPPCQGASSDERRVRAG